VVAPRPATPTGLSYLRASVRPGRSGRAGAVELVNRAARPVRVAIEPVNGITLDTLGSSYAAPGSQARGSTPWLRMRRGTVVVRARSALSLPISVAVPRSARAGDYLSGVSVEALGQRPVQASAGGLATVSAVRYVVGVETAIPGRRLAAIAFTGARLRQDPAGPVFLLEAANSGNAIVTGAHGHVEVTRGARVVLSRPIPAGTFLAHTAIAYPVPAFSEHPSPGTSYLVTAWLRYGRRTAWLRQRIVFGRPEATVQHRYAAKKVERPHAVPWWAFAIAGYALLVTAALSFLLLRRRRARAAEEHEEAEEEPPPRVLAGR
jgi:hypothetical protein